MRRHHTLPFLALLAPAVAQPPLEKVISPTATAAAIQVASPRERLPRAGALAPTAKLAYAAWIEKLSASPIESLQVARTTDAGQTWTVTTIYTAAAAEDIEGFAIGCAGNAVFVGFLSDKNNTTARDDVFVTASADQGTTWSPALQVNTLTNTTVVPGARAQLLVGDASLVGTTPRAYFAFENLVVAGAEDPYFVAVELQNGQVTPVVSELRLNKGVAAGGADIDDVALAADGPVVLLAWRDKRRGSGAKDMYAIRSIGGGADFSQPTVNEQLLSGNAGAGDLEPAFVAVAAPNLYVLYLDYRHAVNVNDEPWLAWSNNLGQNWSEKRLFPNLAPGSFDVDAPAIAAEGNRLVIAFEHDERGRQLSPAPTDPNWADSTWVFVSQDAGQNLAGQYISNPPTPTNFIRCEQPQVDLRGDYVHVSWEESWYNGNGQGLELKDEDLFMARSHDGGLRFTSSVNVTRRGSPITGNARGGDIDNPGLVVTGNRQNVTGYLDDRTGGSANTASTAVRAGPEVWSKASGATALELHDLAAGEAGALALVVVSLTPAAQPWIFPPLFGDLGFEPNLVPDAATSAFLTVAFAYSAPVPAGGGTLQLPLAPDGFGLFRVVGITLHPQRGFLSFTEPNKY